MTATLTIWTKLMRKGLGQAEEMIGMLIQPVLWLLLFGIGMRGFLGGAETAVAGTGSYMTTILPGIIALTGMAGAIAGGLGWLTERTSGVAREYIAAPIRRLSILGAHSGAMVSKVGIQTIVILVVGLIAGASWGAGFAATLVGVALLVAFIVGWSGIGLAFASMTDDAMAYHMMISLFNLPLFFLSDALYPLETMPRWMQVASRFNPLTYLTNGLRATWFDTGAEVSIGLGFSAIVLGGFAVLGMLFALNAFLKSIRN